jgi:hypothetical protein
MVKRIICDIAIFTAIFLGPWWLATAMGLLFTLLFKNYWELFIAGIFMDALYYIPSNKLWGNFGVFVLSSLIIIMAVEKIKKQIRI